jgi:hypothetical protein
MSQELATDPPAQTLTGNVVDVVAGKLFAGTIEMANSRASP